MIGSGLGLGLGVGIGLGLGLGLGLGIEVGIGVGIGVGDRVITTERALLFGPPPSRSSASFSAFLILSLICAVVSLGTSMPCLSYAVGLAWCSEGPTMGTRKMRKGKLRIE